MTQGFTWSLRNCKEVLTVEYVYGLLIKSRVGIIHHESQRLPKQVSLIERTKDLNIALDLGEGRPEGRMIISILQSMECHLCGHFVNAFPLSIVIGVIYRYI